MEKLNDELIEKVAGGSGEEWYNTRCPECGSSPVNAALLPSPGLLYLTVTCSRGHTYTVPIY